MASGTGGTSQLREVAGQLRERLEARSRRVGHLLWRLVVTTAGSCLRYRVTGLAAEAAFFAVLSVPPLVNTTRPGSAPTMAATLSRARSTAARAKRPNRCTDDGFPPMAMASATASATAGFTGAPALKSK